jgi:hypothetical protein
MKERTYNLKPGASVRLFYAYEMSGVVFKTYVFKAKEN